MKSEKLTQKEFHKIIREIKRDWETHRLRQIAPLIFGYKYLYDRVTALENELRKALQPDLFEAKQKHENIVRAQINARAETKKSSPFPERLLWYDKHNLIGSEAWNRDLRYMKVSHNRALEILSQAKQGSLNRGSSLLERPEPSKGKPKPG